MSALAYLLTFSTYGTHLPGSEKGWVDAQHASPCSPMLAFNPKRQAWWRVHLNESPWILEREADRSLSKRFAPCASIGYGSLMLSISGRLTCMLSSSGDTAPERMLSDCKAYATRVLRRALPEVQRRRYWAHHGSTRYLWNEMSLRAAMDYVLNGQGERMACYPDLELN